ncbi:hypothetical protein HMPREF1544_05838 [Mucor circinelloides 1006PhL]|uniref:Uncharacterized protein n=1 Tax=Mucor circinelloides f. circinelloides (strain 1006PhL) TaxID=1220926 RepID=S2JG14_MUCC1|nr:hypothetical protein HMPREF1544_05838 [Mucor circinelloides 1006PhL]
MSIIKKITLCAILGYLAMEVHAYCVYNNVRNPDDKHKTTYWLRQQPYNAGPNYFSRFSQGALGSGEKACCSYTNSDCVRSTNKDDELYMVARRTTGSQEYPPVVISLPAGGWIEFGGDAGPETQTLHVFNPDGTPYDYKYRTDPQAGYT